MLTEDKKRRGRQVIRRDQAGLVPVDPADLMEAYAGTAGATEFKEVPQADTKLTRVDVDKLLSAHSRIWADFSPNIKAQLYNHESKKPHYLPDYLPYNVHDTDSFESADLDNDEYIIEQPTHRKTELARAINRVAELAEIPPERREDFEKAVMMEIEATSTKASPLPKVAPELYADRAIRQDLGRKENIIEFLERVYTDHLTGGELTRPRLRDLDSQGEMALRNWLRQGELPVGWSIPTKKAAVGTEVRDPARVREAWRIARAHQRRAFQP